MRLRSSLAVVVAALVFACGPFGAAARAGACSPQQDRLGAMIGQMLMFGFAGTAPRERGPQAIARQLCEGTIGGVILLGPNVKSRNQVKALTRLFAAAGASAVPLIAIDQEGGRVQRLGVRQGYAALPRAATVGARYSTKQAFGIYLKAARQVREAGFNVNLGPVVDVNVNPRNPIIGRLGRSFAADADTVAAYAKAFIAAHHRSGVLTALKHFPGHGSSKHDSHKGFVDITGTWQRDRELAPYASLLKDARYADMVMSGHLYHSALAAGGREPATLSAGAINGLLRRDMGYDGVVITDDLEMGAIRDNFGFPETIVKAIRAGNDILLISNSSRLDPGLPEKVVAMIKKAVASGEISRAAIERSHARIRKLKQKLAAFER